MNHSLLKPRRWLAVLALLCSTAALWADEVTDMVILGQTGTKVEGQNYYVFNNITSGQVRWYPSSHILELDHVNVTSSSNETFIAYNSYDASLTIRLIGTNTFKYNSKKYAKPVITLRRSCTVESKDVNNPGTLNIWTYGHTSETPAAIWLNSSSYMEVHHYFSVRACTFNVRFQGSSWNPDGYTYSVFDAPSSSYIRVATHDATLSLSSFGAGVLGSRAWMELSDKECVYSSNVDVVNNKLVNLTDNSKMVTFAKIGYPLIFGYYDDYTGEYINHRNVSTYSYSSIEKFGTNGVVEYNEKTKEVTLNGGTAQGDMLWYGKSDLIVNVKGDQLTTIKGLSSQCLKTEYSNIRIRGDHLSNYQGLRLTQSDNTKLECSVKVPANKGVYFEQNAKVVIDNVSVGLACTDPEVAYSEEGWNFDDNQVLNSVLSITNSALDIDAKDIAAYGFKNIFAEGCTLTIPENGQYIKTEYIEDNSWYDDFGEFWNPEYWFYPYTVCDEAAVPFKHLRWERTGGFGIFIGGTEVTLENMYDLNHDYDGFSEVRGVSFDDDTYTVTLDNAYIRTAEMGDCGIKFTSTDFDYNIDLIGDSHIQCDSYIGIMANSDRQPLTIMAAEGVEKMPSLRIDSQWGGIQAYCEAGVTIMGCNLDVTTSKNVAIGGVYNPGGGYTEPKNIELMILYSNVRMTRTDAGPVAAYISYMNTEGCSILTPWQAQFEPSLYGVAYNGQLVEGEVIVGSNIMFEDENVESICVTNWDSNHDGWLNYFEAASVTSLGTAFKGNTQITKFPELQYFTGLELMDEKAFYGCTKLSQLTLPNSLLFYNSQCFARTGLTSINIPKPKDENKTVYLNDGNFMQCAQLSQVTFDEGINLAIGSSVFSHCTSLEWIELPPSVISIPMRSFYGCSSLYSFTANNVKYIGESAFANTSVYPEFLPGGLEEIGDNAFDGCYGEAVYLPKSLRKVGKGALKNFMEIVIPEGSKLEEVGERAFYGCGFWNLTLPPTLHTIGNEAFCSSSSEYTLDITVDRKQPADIGYSIFGYLSDNSHIYVPKGCAQTYKAAWPEYEDYIVDGELSEPTDIRNVTAQQRQGDIYNLRGQLVRRNGTTEGLPAGIYIVNGKKVMVK